KLIGGKWKLCILWQLSQNKMRFGELQRAVGDITQQMLSKQLKEMAKDNLIKHIHQVSIHMITKLSKVILKLWEKSLSL
ncbi:helix-turn-helix transcriptional regulator, partial [Candidatus Pseudothioglobus singularis]|nr:helix-turn-helix transcriptional regulator [Candidatus Pseudothioglobus singularis]